MNEVRTKILVSNIGFHAAYSWTLYNTYCCTLHTAYCCTLQTTNTFQFSTLHTVYWILLHTKTVYCWKPMTFFEWTKCNSWVFPGGCSKACAAYRVAWLGLKEATLSRCRKLLVRPFYHGTACNERLGKWTNSSSAITLYSQDIMLQWTVQHPLYITWGCQTSSPAGNR